MAPATRDHVLYLASIVLQPATGVTITFIETLASGKSGFSAIALSDQTVNVVDKIALVRHVFNGTRRNAPSGDDKMKLAILTVWLQQQEQWKLLARQAAKL